MEESMAAVTRREQAAVMGHWGRWGFKENRTGNHQKNHAVRLAVDDSARRKGRNKIKEEENLVARPNSPTRQKKSKN